MCVTERERKRERKRERDIFLWRTLFVQLFKLMRVQLKDFGVKLFHISVCVRVCVCLSVWRLYLRVVYFSMRCFCFSLPPFAAVAVVVFSFHFTFTFAVIFRLAKVS